MSDKNLLSSEYIQVIICAINMIATLMLALSTRRISKEIHDIQVFSNIDCYLIRDNYDDKKTLVLRNLGPVVIRNITISNNWRSLFCKKYKIIDKPFCIEYGSVEIGQKIENKDIDQHIVSNYINVSSSKKEYIPLNITFFVASAKRKKAINI